MALLTALLSHQYEQHRASLNITTALLATNGITFKNRNIGKLILQIIAVIRYPAGINMSY
ncbi:hypothetical protein E2K93_14245 [Thalassotalea sp. HSM 43]|uniref:hypothetical protein n=1 Tax=Thalassotalea sp. HSM 43 TaxID=2552945 RepID=UPI0010813110|nr:hypothetical protein [Thalassotalea sp. HSM 43]QBY05458.1 hypothetical protein E2K93_14245 [Thalassotalea sp. HSM 43]